MTEELRSSAGNWVSPLRVRDVVTRVREEREEGGEEKGREMRGKGGCKDMVCATQQIIFRMAETEIWFVWDFQPFQICCAA